MIDVLVVGDSQVVRDYLVFLIENDPDLHVVGTAANGGAALELLATHRHAVILMDIHMPGIHGYEATRQIMSAGPVSIVVCTGSSRFSEVSTTMDVLRAGAFAVLKAPSGLGDPGADVEAAAVIRALKLMSEIKRVRRWNGNGAVAAGAVPAVSAPTPFDSAGRDVAVVAIGASTGGPHALLEILVGLPASFPAPVLVVQHITGGFTSGFAAWLNSNVRLRVQVANGGETPLPGHVYIAPDDRHLQVDPRGKLQTTQDEPHNGLRPSVGTLFASVADRFGRRSAGVLLTGMGEDGAEELKLIADQGGLTLAQDQESCAVFGMPAEAIKLDAAGFVLPPKKIAELLISSVRPGAR